VTAPQVCESLPLDYEPNQSYAAPTSLIWLRHACHRAQLPSQPVALSVMTVLSRAEFGYSPLDSESRGGGARRRKDAFDLAVLIAHVAAER
jgi:hypothetical protein